MDSEQPSSEEIALRYLEELPWPPYPFQEQAIFTWFDSEDGILVCAPTGTGKTVIAETALYEALMTGRRAYYTTPLIALTEQKFRELQDSAVRWGFSANDVGLITGNRRENSDARILVVVAEILLNRLLSPEEVSFDDVAKGNVNHAATRMYCLVLSIGDTFGLEEGTDERHIMLDGAEVLFHAAA